MNFSARAHDRILKITRTLADLAGAMNIRPADVLEATPCRSLDLGRGDCPDPHPNAGSQGRRELLKGSEKPSIP